MSTVAQNPELLKNLFTLLAAHRSLFGQERVWNRVVALAVGELFVFARHTITPILMALGLAEQDGSAWYRRFRRGRFNAARASAVLLAETLAHVRPDARSFCCERRSRFYSAAMARQKRGG